MDGVPYIDCTVGSASVLIQDPCCLGLPQVLAVAHMFEDTYRNICVPACNIHVFTCL